MVTATVFQPTLYPLFPAEVPSVELQTISLAKLLDEDKSENSRLLEICKMRGFFYLDFEGTPAAHLTKDADLLAQLAEESFKLPLEEKQKYSYQDGTIIGYKNKGKTITDKKNTPDTAEFFNISKNDFAAGAHSFRWPAPILNRSRLINTFTHTAHSTGLIMISALARQLSLDPAIINSMHRYPAHSQDHIRLTYGPPRSSPDPNNLEIQTPAHTDFGTITLLFNWLGGLQVYSRSSRGTDESNVVDSGDGEWLWVRPKPNHAIVNLGEAAAIFTNGVLCAGRHRVVPAPGEQGKFGRYSVVYFVRPEDEAVMRALEAEGIPEKSDEERRKSEVEGLTAKEWIMRQATRLNRKEATVTDQE